MAVISIIGCAGVGKSTLVKQLAALNRCPAFFEGEEGVFPEVVTKNLITSDPVARERWFVKQYADSLHAAHQISLQNIDCYIDNASSITIQSYAAIAGSLAHGELQELITYLDKAAPTVTVILIAKAELLAAYIAKRGRVSEEVVSIAEQAKRVQDEFIARAEPNKVLLLDRSGLDFNNASDIWSIDAHIKHFIKTTHRIPGVTEVTA